MSVLALAFGFGTATASHADPDDGPSIGQSLACTIVDPAFYAQTCVAFALGGGAYRMGERGFLARENIGSGTLITGYVTPSQIWRSETISGSISTAVDRDNVPDSLRNYVDGRVFGLSFMLSRASLTVQYPTIDVGAGHGLGIPGIDGGPSGIFLPTHPFNIVNDATYHGDLRWGQVSLDSTQNRANDSGSEGFSVGVRYSYLDQQEDFGGSVPAYAGGFRYEFNARSDALGAHIGYQRTFNLSDGSGSGWSTNAQFRAQAGLAYINAQGDAWLGFSGGLNVVAPSYRMYDESALRPYGSVELGLSTTNLRNGLTLSLGVTYDLRPWGVGFSGDGTNPYTMEIQDMQAWNVVAALGLRF